MNDTNITHSVATNLNQVLLETIQQVKGGIGKGVDFAVEQAPEVCSQLLAWKLAEAIMIIVSMTLLLASAVWLTWKYRKPLKKLSWDDTIDMIDPGFMLPLFVWLFLFIAFVVTVPRAVRDVAKITFAPKIYLIEYAAKLIK